MCKGKVQWKRQFLDRLLIKILHKKDLRRDGNIGCSVVWYYHQGYEGILQSRPLSLLPCVSVLRFVRISYLRLILTDCGNGYEIVKLLDSQFDASSSYAEGPTEAEKTQSRIDHMPSMGQINNTKGRGSYLFYREHCRWVISIYTLSDSGVFQQSNWFAISDSELFTTYRVNNLWAKQKQNGLCKLAFHQCFWIRKPENLSKYWTRKYKG